MEKTAIFFRGLTRETVTFAVNDLADAYNRHEELLEKAGWDTTLEWINISIEGEKQTSFDDVRNNEDWYRLLCEIEHGGSDTELIENMKKTLYNESGYIYSGFNPFK